MRIIIVGSSTSGLLLALNLKSKDPSLDVLVIEKNTKLAKKMYATGNGKCNVGNLVVNDNTYNDKKVLKLLDKYNIHEQMKLYASFGLMTKTMGNLVYPFSENSTAFVNHLVDLAHEKKIQFYYETNVIDYKFIDDCYQVITTEGIYKADKVIFAVGGTSSPVYGSDGNLIKCFKNHGYRLTNIYPGLCALKTETNVKSISGQRVKAKVQLLKNGKSIYEEQGEVIFKDNGIGGIAIMNCASLIARNGANFKDYEVKLDLTVNLNNELKELINESKLIDSMFTVEMAKFLKDYLKKTNSSLDNVIFKVNDFYGFKDSQVTVGGIDTNDIKENFESKIEPNVYFIGEVLNYDGLCGGYNIMLCAAEAMYVSDLMIGKEVNL